MNDSQSRINKIASKPMTLLALSQEIGISKPTLQKWICEITDDIGDKRGNFYTPKQVRIILENFL